MKVVFYPAFKTIEDFNDIYYRAVWHFSHAAHLEVEFLLDYNVDVSERVLPNSFDNEIEKYEKSFLKRAEFNEKAGTFIDSLSCADVVMKWQELDSINQELAKFKNKRVYRVDPARVRQEGSFYIQCVFDNSIKLKQEAEESKAKFDKLCSEIEEKKSSWILATGPSVEEYKKHSFDKSLVIACNSTVLDDELFNRTSPKILVFADPIFHFGVSRYAAEFRKIVLKRLESSDFTIVVPLKYYSLLTSVFYEYAHRIIGIEFDDKIDFNLDLKSQFKVKTTSNILTLLLFPLATTFSKDVNVLGCDGRPFENDDYFWGHGKLVQINSEMGNIQEVHPGFFKIDYNEYYFEHCHILDVMIEKAKQKGIRIRHLAQSYIPALRDTLTPCNKSLNFDHVVLIEPDGIGVDGHYVSWHNQLIDELKKVTESITVLCNKKQETKWYKSGAIKTFTSHSWAISRSDWSKKRNFKEHVAYKRFASELEGYFIDNKRDLERKVVSVFCYYGSVQILDILNGLKRKTKELGFELKVSLCLFHESVILDSTQKAPSLLPQARTILLEGLAQRDNYNIRAVTQRLSDFLYDKIEVQTDFMANPLPADELHLSVLDKRDKFTVLFPCALRQEKGSQITREYIEHVMNSHVDVKIVTREFSELDNKKNDSVLYIPKNISDEDYRGVIANSDIVVIPYRAPQFTYRTSGIIVDAMLAGKPVITIQDTWLSDVVRTYRFGLSIKYFSPYSLTSAINTIRNNYEFFQVQANKSYDKYCNKNSWPVLVRQMFSYLKY